MYYTTGQKILVFSGLIITLLFGIWHLFVPKLYKWFSYIPDVPLELKNAITATNFFLSLALILISVLAFLIFQNSTPSRMILQIICFPLGILWAARLIYQVFIPQGLMIQNLRYYLIIIFLIPFCCFIIPLLQTIWNK
jgi:hypothetical protein